MDRDDLIVNEQYAVDMHHDEDTGRQIRKKIVFVTVLLTAITIVEVGLGVSIRQGTTLWPVVKWAFIVMTLVKAGYIVMVFMHLGDERKNLKLIILGPYIAFIGYLIFICLDEALAMYNVRQIFGGWM